MREEGFETARLDWGAPRGERPTSSVLAVLLISSYSRGLKTKRSLLSTRVISGRLKGSSSGGRWSTGAAPPRGELGAWTYRPWGHISESSLRAV